MTVAILSVATMMVAPVSVGYASSYTATTQSTGNEISTSYFNVNLYLKTDTNYGSDLNYQPTSSIVKTDINTIRYTKDENDPTINRIGGSYNVTKENIFLRITETGYTGGSYSASASGTAIDGGGYNILSSSSVLLYEYGGMTEGQNPSPIWDQVNIPDHPLVPNKYYLVRYFANFNNEIIHGTPVNNKLNLTITPQITVTRTSPLDGSFIPGSGSITISYSSNTDAQAIISDNDPENLNGFDLIDATEDTNYTSGGQHCQAVNIDNPNSEGITSGGKADVDVKIPANTKFIVAIDGSGGNKHNTITVTITATGINYTETTPLRNDIYLTPNGTSNSMPNPTPNSNWFVTTDSSGINIHFLSENSNGGTDSAKAYIVLCPSTT